MMFIDYFHFKLLYISVLILFKSVCDDLVVTCLCSAYVAGLKEVAGHFSTDRLSTVMLFNAILGFLYFFLHTT